MREKPFRRLRVIISEDKSETDAHARMTIRALEVHDRRHPSTIKPRGVANYAAQFPILCSECTITYWSRDEYASHPGCKGTPPKQSAGFKA